MLCEIPEESKEEAQRILTFLCFSYRPLTVFEVMSALAVDISDQECYDHHRKFEEPEDILRTCPGLIDIIPFQPSTVYYSDCDRDHCHSHDRDGDAGRYTTIRISHFSVQEYLLSDRIMQASASFFGTSKVTGHYQISKTCLVYLCSRTILSRPHCSGEYPFSEYAAEYWHRHLLEDGVDRLSDLNRLALSLLSNRESLLRWRGLYDVVEPLIYYTGGHSRFQQCKEDAEELEARSPVFDTTVLGLYDVLVNLLALSPQDVNVSTRCYTALQAAVKRGNIQVVQLLLDSGADINARERAQRTALFKAVDNRYESERLLKLLLDHGANVNAGSGHNNSTLIYAVKRGNEVAVEILLDRRADIRAPKDESLSCPLSMVAERSHEEIVKLMLEREVNINDYTSEKDEALRQAVKRGSKRIVKLLLERGANVNAWGTSRFPTLTMAIFLKNFEIAEALLDHGADITLVRKPEYKIALKMTKKRKKHSEA